MGEKEKKMTNEEEKGRFEKWESEGNGEADR